MAAWIASLKPDKVVMESTSVYWKSPYAALEAVGICATVVNARHVKKLPGRKTDISDAEWLASLARANLLSASFVPPQALRELRIVARERQNIVSMLSAEKNRMHKVLTDGGIRLGVVVSDIHGKSARGMIKALIAQQPPETVLQLASKRLKATKEQLTDALEGELTASHLFTLTQLMQNIEYFEKQINQFDAYLTSELCKEVLSHYQRAAEAVSFFLLTKIKRYAEFQRDAISNRSDLGLHQMVCSLFVKHSKFRRNDARARRISRPFDS
jgi:hypothetical protein